MPVLHSEMQYQREETDKDAFLRQNSEANDLIGFRFSRRPTCVLVSFEECNGSSLRMIICSFNDPKHDGLICVRRKQGTAYPSGCFRFCLQKAF